MGGRSGDAKVVRAGRRAGSGRLRSQIAGALRLEIEAMADRPVRKLVDFAVLRQALASAGPELFDAEVISEVAIGMAELSEKRLGKEKRSLAELLDADLVAGIEAVLADRGSSGARAGAYDDLVAAMIRQPFVGKMFAEVIHSAIVSFNKKVNPLFGGIATAVLDEQIRGFIELGMPLLQEQAVSFALSGTNRAFAADLGRGMFRAVIEEPVAELVPRTSKQRRRRVRHLLAASLDNERLQVDVQRAGLQMFDDLEQQLGSRRLGDLVDVEALASVVAEPLAALVAGVLALPEVAVAIEEAQS